MAFDMTKFSLEMITVVLLCVCSGASSGLAGPNEMFLSENDPYNTDGILLEPIPNHAHGFPNIHCAIKPKRNPKALLDAIRERTTRGQTNSLVTRTSGDEEGGSKSLGVTQDTRTGARGKAGEETRGPRPISLARSRKQPELILSPRRS
ncbi:uncharacterized protein LOC122261568 [Penaeus japonicus]|uniref:uncharacterized protein LOC122261568 n=1 Tax=Penaeus japonicus TaxID=27405 RepID=UPI001C70EFAB|nr:uncharacterized protein LOC122261568 [Penaeus japonicus]